MVEALNERSGALGGPCVGGGGSQRGSVTWRLLLVSVAQPVVHGRAISPLARRNRVCFRKVALGIPRSPQAFPPGLRLVRGVSWILRIGIR